MDPVFRTYDALIQEGSIECDPKMDSTFGSDALDRRNPVTQTCLPSDWSVQDRLQRDGQQDIAGWIDHIEPPALPRFAQLDRLGKSAGVMMEEGDQRIVV